jgi:selenocysteine lyase/cysteine desulfurase
MTLAEILSNETVRQREFPVARRLIYLAHAGVCALPRRVSDAITAYASQCVSGDQEDLLPPEFIPQTRALAAGLLRAQPEDIALVGPTSLALSGVAAGLPWRKGDNVLIYLEDYPSNVYPWLALADRGVEVRLLQTPGLGCIRPLEVLGQVDEHTRLVALASCHFVAGFRIDHEAIGRLLHERGIRFCVDAIQTLGAFPTTVEHIDFLAAGAHKWLLGPCAAGLLYVRKSLQEELAPTAFGWHNIRCPNYTAQAQIVFQPDARRYEPGTANLLGLVGLRAALELLSSIGAEAIAAELLRKRAWLVPALQAKGCVVLHADAPPENAGAIISFHRPGGDMAALHQKLAAAGVIASLRADRAGRRYLRFSPHFYNTDEELRRALELL